MSAKLGRESVEFHDDGGGPPEWKSVTWRTPFGRVRVTNKRPSSFGDSLPDLEIVPDDEEPRGHVDFEGTLRSR